MRSHQAIITDAGPEKVSEELGVSINTTRSWQRRDSIPGDFWLTFQSKGWADLAELAAHAARNPRSRPDRPTQMAIAS